MKKLLFKTISVIMAIVLIMAQMQTLSAKPLVTQLLNVDESVFVLDETALNLALSELNKLDEFLNSNEGITYSDLEVQGSELITNISDIAAPLGMAQGNEDLLGIPAFWWGCVLGWVGLILVYVLTDKDKEQTKKAMYGCLVSTGVSIVISIIYYVWVYNAVESSL